MGGRSSPFGAAAGALCAPAIDAMGDPIFDVTIRGAFPRFVTRPVDAMFYGADGGIAVTPVPWLELGAQASLVRARNRTDDSYLVFVPPDRVRYLKPFDVKGPHASHGQNASGIESFVEPCS